METPVRETKVQQIFNGLNAVGLQIDKLESFIASLEDNLRKEMPSQDKVLPSVVSMWNNLPLEMSGISERIEKATAALREIFI
jgi:hypothetical protein